MKARSILLAAFCLALCAADGPVRTWTDSTEKYTIEAELVGVDNGKVRLKKNHGSIVTVPLVKMSTDDRAFLQRRLPDRKQSEVVTLRFGTEIIERRRTWLSSEPVRFESEQDRDLPSVQAKV